jgi:class 3 adenylate cyclase/tetratricopeptide (TPR) repeat protein
MKCPACGHENREGAKFCEECGRILAREATARAEERKVVSVLFVDLVGFTSRSDRADPEDVRDFLQDYHRRVKEEIERFGGTVEKFIGDAVMAVFGAPVAHTDDPERAVRAGLRALESVEELNRSRPDWNFGARAAVTTGEAVVTVGSGHAPNSPLALGDVVNTASRLQSSAPPGRLVVSDETYRATRDAIRYEEFEPVKAKGKRDSIPVWLAVKPVAGPAERRMRTTPLVGRQRELSLLQSVWERATAENRPHLVTIIGPPGIGKSRLSRDFAALVRKSGGRTVFGRCLPYDTRDVYGAFALQVKEIAGIFEQDPSDVARGKLIEALSACLADAEVPEITRSISLMLGLGLDPPVDEQAILLFAARRLVEGLGSQQPMLFLFEDVHWADAGQLDLIQYLAAHAREAPVVLLALARPELMESRPSWGQGLWAQTTISLDPLADEEATTVIAHLVGEELLPQSVGRLVGVAGGNPLFLEELTAALTEGADVGGELPTTVRAVIAARIECPSSRAPQGSPVRLGGGPGVLEGFSRTLGRTGRLDEVLDALEAKELIRREPTSRMRGDAEFSFRHILIRDVCYATLPRAERKTAHDAVARYIEGVAGEMDRELAWLLAHHWEQAGDARRAIDYLLLSAERAQEAMAEDEAMDLFERAHDIAADEATRTRIRFLQALALVRFEDYDPAVPSLEALTPTLEGVDKLEALLGLARACQWTERTAQVIDVAGQALEMAQGLEAREFIGPAMARLSQGHGMRGDDGDLDRSIELGERALELWVPGSGLEELPEHNYMLAHAHYWTGGYERAMELSQAARDTAVDPSSGEALLRGGGMEGLLLAARGRYEEAISSFDAVIAFGRELGRPVRVLLNYSTAAFREIFDLEEARRRSEESLTIKGRSSSFHMPWMNALVDLIHTDVLAGEIGAAEARWLDLWEEVLATPAWEQWLLAGRMAALRAQIALVSESPVTTTEWAERAIALARQCRRVKYEAVARGVLGHALLALDRPEDAMRELRAAVNGADALGNPAGRWRAQADLARGLQATGDDEAAVHAFGEAAEIIREMTAGLAPQRAERFTSVPEVAEVLETSGGSGPPDRAMGLLRIAKHDRRTP